MSGECLDPETLALWADDELEGAQRAAAEKHVADCARCQATLAALVRTSAVPERPRPWWRLSRAAWLAPLTAAVAALVIWIAVPNAPPPSPPSPPSEVARQQPENAPVVKTAPAAAPHGDQKQRADKPLAAPRAAPAPSSEAPAAPPAQPSAERGALAQAAAPAARFAAANVAAPEVLSPDPMSRWRIASSGIVEHSTDGGGTWQAQATGATPTLTAGSAPSVSTCWLVGQDGVVLLSTDGLTWRRVGSPTTTALVSIRATDDRTATVTDAAGRTYVTADAGVTWMLRQ